MNEGVRQNMDVLMELVVLDEDIRKLDVELAKEREAVEAARGELTVLREALEKDRTQLTRLENERGERMQEARQHSQNLERSREKMNRSRNEKDVNLITRELEELRKLLRDSEEAVGKYLVEIEGLKKALADKAPQEAALLARLGETEGKASARLGDLEKGREERIGRRTGIAEKLPSLLLRKYDQVRSRKNSGAALMEAGRCKGCNMSIPPQQVQRVNRLEGIEQCPSCNRFLVPRVTPTAPPKGAEG